MELLCEGLGLEAGKFKELTFLDARVLVGHCYPYCPQPDLTVGITSHTDPGVITVLLQNHVPGLQVKHGDEWVNVKPVPGGLIINAGDFLQVKCVGVFFNSLHSVAREFSQYMDANEDLSPRVIDANEDLSPRVGMEFDTLEDA
ncbi:hypothetical protein SO802_030802 [Lithocarpus litseifolius]|uniref:Fe2OG dioxygenase domain-containing protein n=1 Tax=Lithocarpus litseifolius TaxID=425828 RepID=A0AAW2BIU7_9ROSI